MSAAEQTTTSRTASSQPGPSNAGRDPDVVRPPASRTQTTTEISLIDRTSTRGTAATVVGGEEAVEEEAGEEGAETPTPGELNRRWTRQSLQQSLAQRKYAKYQEDRLFARERPEGDSASEDDQSRMQWGKRKVKGLLKAKRQFQLAQKEDAAIDVLWENQRGWWAFGVPHFSSKSLLNFDPKAWLNGHRKPSPVNITNAQVPDPDWQWEWKSWYVDMSRDVDEEGWEYSFAFSRGFAWHGNHPWGHSWVRRRRWLRKRVRKHTRDNDVRGGAKGMSAAHHLNADYFTIHPSNNPSRANSLAPSTMMNKLKSHMVEEYVENPADVRDIGTLLVHLKRAALDREKIVLVRHFVENGGEDVYYLEEQMSTIMSLCIFQNSRRQLLSMLMDKCDAASRHRADHEKSGEVEGPQEKRQIDNLMRAIKAADQQVKKLEYWSDQRRLVTEGKAGIAPDDDQGWNDNWQGVDNSGPGSNIRTSAKEKGKAVEDVVREESHEQISPSKGTEQQDEEAKYETAEENQKSGDGDGDGETEGRKEDSGESFETPEEDPRLTESPRDAVHKGKGKAAH